jgi:hypothetical protein
LQPHDEKDHQKGVHSVEDDAGQMMPDRICPPDGIVYGMGYPGKRMPVAGIEIKEGKPEESDIERANI